jgi:hypothetical protein
MTPIRRRVVFGLAAMAIAVCAASATLLAVDVYLHGRYQKSAGFNVWGYRGPAVGKKAADEFRVVVLGGSAAYGYGVSADEAIPAVLERLLRTRAQAPVFTVVNLAYNNEGAYSFKTTLEDYRWLDYDLAVLYEGYNDLADEEHTNVQVFRHDSPMFRLTGYMPIFPIIFKEKAAAMLNGGDPGAMYRPGPKTVFNASLATRAGAGVLDATATVAKSLEAQIGRLASEPVHHVDRSVASGCRNPWGSYCQSIAAAVEHARAEGRQVIVGTQPYLSVSQSVHDAHVGQQAELRAMLQRRFSADPDVRYVDFGNRLDLEDPRMSFDHMHLTVAGNQEIAAALVDPVMAMAARRRPKTS